MSEKTKFLETLNQDYQKRYGWSDAAEYLYKASPGLSEELVRAISKYKKEPAWMLESRLKALKYFQMRPLPDWGGDLSKIDFDKIHYFASLQEKPERSWDDVPPNVKQTFEKLGIPEAEQKYLAGVSAQYDSEAIYHNIEKELEKQGVIFMDMDSALKEHEDIVREHFATIIPLNDNKLAALNSAVWSGGSFVYVPEGVEVKMPLQAYFRINSENVGQFERTLIIAEEGAKVSYAEGCTAPVYSSQSLHSAVVEIIARPYSDVHYLTTQNWSPNVYNLVTKRAAVYERARMRWTDANLGSAVTMKYPSIYLLGREAHGEVLSMAFAGKNQQQDSGAKIFHAAEDTTSNVFSKSISKDGGRASYRGLLEVAPGATNTKSTVVCDALLLDEYSRSDTYPTIKIGEPRSVVGHEASVSRVGEEQLFYLQAHGLSEEEAQKILVNGFIEPVVKHLPMEYAVELNRLIDLEMEGSIG